MPLCIDAFWRVDGCFVFSLNNCHVGDLYMSIGFKAWISWVMLNVHDK